MKRFLALATAPFLVAGFMGTAQAVEQDPVKLGADLVEHLGCLYCHGLGGRRGIENPNAVRKYVPAWDEATFIERYPTPEKVRETIRKGRFPQKDPQAEGSPIPMPPWGNRLNDEELDAVIAYIWSLRETPVETHAKGGRGSLEEDGEDETAKEEETLREVREMQTTAPAVPTRTPGDDRKVALGQGLVDHLGCLYCHGLGGRKGLENPNAVRKYVPAWDEEEFIKRYPVADGVRWVIANGRFPEKDPQAEGNPIPMPPWGNRLKPEELEAIVAYIWSLRATPVGSHPKGGIGANP